MSMMKKLSTKRKILSVKRIVLFMMLILMSFGLFAESDNGEFLPSKEPFAVSNIYLQIEPLKLQFPMLFTGFKSEKDYTGFLTSVGGAGSFEFGYNWSGWLFGAHLGYSYYKAMDNKPLIREFQNLTVGFNLSRVLSFRTFSSLPTWLEFTPFIGMGADLYKARYYQSFDDKEFDRINDSEGRIKTVNLGQKAAFYIRGGLQMDFDLGTDYAIPFVGLEGNIVPDKDGMSFFSSLSLGLRSYPGAGASKTVAYNKGPGVYVFVDESKNKKDGAPIIVNLDTHDLGDGGKENIKNWTVIAYDSKGKELKKWTGEGKIPESLEWDGKDEVGNPIPADSDYSFKANMELKDGNTVSDETYIVRSKELPKSSLALTVENDNINPYGKLEDQAVPINFETKDLEKDAVKYWTVDILDPKGNIIRTLRGRGNPPKKVTWDGRDRDGNLPLARSVYTIKTTLFLKDSNKNVAETSVKTGEPIVKFVQSVDKFDPQGEAKTVDFAFETKGLSNENLEYWTVIIMNPMGKVVKTLKGSGMPPEKITWDGKDDRGNLVPSGEKYKVASDIRLKDGLHITEDTYVRTAVPAGKQDIIIDVNTDTFTPDGDGVNDNLNFIVKAKNIEKPEELIESWDLSIYDPNNDLFKKIEGKGLPPKDLTWDGTDENGEYVVSAKTYRADMNVKMADGKKLKKSVNVDTGILVRKDKEGHLRIQVTSINFDPSAATFKTLSAEKIFANEKTLRDVAKVIKKYEGYNVTIEGHANRTARGKRAIEREEKRDLMPLSEARAKAIMQKLIDLGVSADRLSAMGMGGQRLVVDPYGKKRWKNRRVEFILTKQE